MQKSSDVTIRRGKSLIQRKRGLTGVLDGLITRGVFVLEWKRCRVYELVRRIRMKRVRTTVGAFNDDIGVELRGNLNSTECPPPPSLSQHHSIVVCGVRISVLCLQATGDRQQAMNVETTAHPKVNTILVPLCNNLSS